MNRRDLFARLGKTMLLAAASPILVRCGSETTPPSTTGLTETSSLVGHTHTFNITQAELDTPVAISRADTLVGHTHLVTLSASEVTTIAGGGSVTITSGTGGGHTHTYTFKI